MSEFIEDEPQQILPEPEILQALRSAITWIERPLEWMSSDSYSFYYAKPLLLGSDEEMPYGRLSKMPAWRFYEMTGTWLLEKDTRHEDSDRLTIDKFLITAGGALAATAVTSVAIYDELADNTFLRNSLNDDMTRQIASDRAPELRDYANIFNALYDLAPIAERERETLLKRHRNMTKDEIRHQRALERSWIIEPEMDKKAAPKWWGVSIGNMSYLVKASSGEEAVLDVEDSLELREPAFMCFVEPHADTFQPVFEEKYGERKLLRMIPFSAEEWPDSPDNMTEAQKAACKKLERPVSSDDTEDNSAP